MGVLSFHCVFCPTKMDHGDEFILHYMIHFRDVFEIKEELQDDVTSEPNAAIVEADFTGCDEIKVEQPTVCDDLKSEHSYVEDRSSCSDNESVNHQSTVKFVDPRKCGICGETFFVRKLLKNHIRVHQAGPVPKFYECDVCGRRVNQKKNLLTHIRRRHGQKVKCQICGKMLRQHYMVRGMGDVRQDGVNELLNVFRSRTFVAITTKGTSNACCVTKVDSLLWFLTHLKFLTFVGQASLWPVN